MNAGFKDKQFNGNVLPGNRVVAILLYHGLNDNPSDRLRHWTTPPAEFARHMDVLVEENVRCLTVTQYVNELRTDVFEKMTGNRKVALVTFDDGWADFAEHAAPIMVERNIPSTLYVTTGFVTGGTTEKIVLPSEPMLSWSQIPELLEQNVEIGAHSHSHPQMDTLLPGRAWDELTRSKALLEDALGQEVRSFAYPHGYNSAHLRYQTKLAGYDTACAVRDMLSHTNDDLFRIARFTVTDDTTASDVRNLINGSGAPVASSKEHVKTIGWRAYRYGKALLTNKVGTDYK